MNLRPTQGSADEHPITVEPNPHRIVAKIAGRTIADTTAALVLREASYPSVHYIPREDVDQSVLKPTDTTTHCPYKGEASHFGVHIGDEVWRDAVWTYEKPLPVAVAISGYVAFYPDQVQVAPADPLP